MRQISPDVESPIPIPTPIDVDDIPSLETKPRRNPKSPVADNPEAVLEQLSQPPTQVPNQVPNQGGLPSMTQPFPTSGPMPGMGMGMGMDSHFGPSGMQSAGPPPIEYPLAEIFTLRSVEQIGKTIQVVTNRDGFITVLGASPKDGTLTKPADSVRIVGRKLGVVELTVIGEKGVKTYRLKITPSVAQLETLIARQFPLSSVEVTAAGDHMLVVEGTVETPGDIEGILTLLQTFVGSKGKVINGIKVAGVSQVQLEVVIARVNRTEFRRLGLNFEYAGKGGFGGSQIGKAGGVTPIASSVANTAATSGGNAFQNIGGAATSAIMPESTVFAGVTHELQQFMAQLEFLKKNGVAKVLARPTLITLSGRPAEFLVGGEQPFPYQVSVLSQPSVDFKKFGTRLNFLPVILGPDKIRLDLVPEFSIVDESSLTTIGGIQVPRFITQRIHTVVEMEPGQTLVLGGLLQTEATSQIDKIPYLGDLPFAGAAFRRVTHSENELELLIVVTPRLVHPLDGSEGPVSIPGDESRVPTDQELFFHGLPEAPHCPDPSALGYSQGSRERSKQPRQEPNDSSQTNSQPVVAQAQGKPPMKSKSWLRFPSVTRQTEKGSQSRLGSNPSLVVQRATTPTSVQPAKAKTAQPANDR